MTSILTYPIKHRRNFNEQLAKAQKVANYAIANKLDKKKLSSKYVKEYGLKSAISNQILRKYCKGSIKQATNVNLIIPGQAIKYNEEIFTVTITPLNISFRWSPGRPFKKINQIEISNEKFMVSATFTDTDQIETSDLFALDLNCGYGRHIINGADMKNEHVLNLGKKGPHIRYKYHRLRQKFQKEKNRKAIKQINNKEKRIMRDIDHKLSRKVVNYALKEKLRIVLEDLKGIRTGRKKSGNGSSRGVNRIVHSWSFYRLQKFIVYKAKLLGIPVSFVSPHYTSQTCSYCKVLGERKGKYFQCTNKKCGKKMNSDINAAYCIGKRYKKEL